jgi:hypothetical protein
MVDIVHSVVKGMKHGCSIFHAFVGPVRFT